MAVGLVEGTEKCGGRVVLVNEVVDEVVSEVVNEVVEKLEAVLVGSAVSVVGGEDRFVTRRLGLLGSR